MLLLKRRMITFLLYMIRELDLAIFKTTPKAGVLCKESGCFTSDLTFCYFSSGSLCLDYLPHVGILPRQKFLLFSEIFKWLIFIPFPTLHTCFLLTEDHFDQPIHTCALVASYNALHLNILSIALVTS